MLTNRQKQSIIKTVFTKNENWAYEHYIRNWAKKYAENITTTYTSPEDWTGWNLIRYSARLGAEHAVPTDPYFDAKFTNEDLKVTIHVSIGTVKHIVFQYSDSYLADWAIPQGFTLNPKTILQNIGELTSLLSDIREFLESDEYRVSLARLKMKNNLGMTKIKTSIPKDIKDSWSFRDSYNKEPGYVILHCWSNFGVELSFAIPQLVEVSKLEDIWDTLRQLKAALNKTENTPCICYGKIHMSKPYGFSKKKVEEYFAEEKDND